jgi:hypothetical protein
MKTEHNRLLRSCTATLAALAWLAPPPAAGAEARTVNEHRAADPNGQVEVNNVAGRVEVVGWDRPEVEVTGTLGRDVDKVNVESSGARTTVRVVRRGEGGSHHGVTFGLDPDEAKLVLHVPQHSSLNATLVSCDLKVSGLSGDQQLHTVSGDVSTNIAHEAHIRTVSGDITVNGNSDTRVLEIGTVSGDLHVSGSAGDVSVSTVSGDGMLTLGVLTRARFKTVSGDFVVNAGLSADGRFEAESVSGDLSVTFSGPPPPAEYDLQSFSGDLKTCFGPKAAHEGYGPGSRLSFREGTGTARVRVDTKSGDVSICTSHK